MTATPHGMQHLLARANWDTDGVRDDLRDYVVGALGDTDGVLVVDETGDLKKGVHTVGVQRQYTGTAGPDRERAGRGLPGLRRSARARDDRPGALPARVLDQRPRPAADAAGVPTDIEFATKPALATGMLVRALAAEVPARWLTGDEVYGADPRLRAELRGQPARLRPGDRLRPPHPHRRRPDPRRRVGRRLPRRAWHRLSAGPGAKGHRFYDWAWIDHTDRAHRDDPLDTQRWSLLIRRHRDTGELAFYRCYSPEPVPLRELVRVAGRRWTHRGGLPGRQGSGRAGRAPGPSLDLLAALDPAGDDRPRTAGRHRRRRARRPTRPDGLIALTCNEIRRLFTDPDRRTRPRHRLPAGLVTLATPPPTPRPTSHYQRRHAEHPHP